MAAELRIAGVDHGGGGVLVAAEAAPVVQTGEEVCGHGLGRFDLDRDQAVTQVDQDVDLVAGRVAPEIERRNLAAVEEVLMQLGYDEALEDGAAR